MIVDIELFRHTPSTTVTLYPVDDPGPAVLIGELVDARPRSRPMGAYMEGPLLVPLTPVDARAIVGTTIGIGLEPDPVDARAQTLDLQVIFGLKPLDARAVTQPLYISEPVATTRTDIRPSWERPIPRLTIIEAIAAGGD